MSYLASNEMMVTHAESEAEASEFPMKGFIIRGVISGVVLAMTATRSGAPISDESMIPISVAILMMLCLELIMGVFSVMAKRTNIIGMFQNLLWVVIGNCLGSALYGFFFIASIASMLSITTAHFSDRMVGIDEIKFLVYTAHHGLDNVLSLMKCLLPS